MDYFNYWIKKINLLASLRNSGNNMIQLVIVDILKLKHLVTMATSQMEYNFRKGQTQNGPVLAQLTNRGLLGTNGPAGANLGRSPTIAK